MKLRRIEIANFRKLGGPIVLDGLGDGLVLVSGQNEEGKSTVLAALKAAFFEHHTVGGAVREAMAPRVNGRGVPEVAVTFDCGGTTYALRKAFRRGGVQLDCDGRSCSDDAAERRLQELLRFERRTAHSPKPENAGLQALFWIDQATTFRGFEALAGSRDRLTAAISAEVGAVAGGDQVQRLLVLAKERAAGFYTSRNEAERGNLKLATDRLRTLEEEREKLGARRREHEGRVDKLARLRDERRRFVDQDELGQAQAKLQDLERRLAEIDELVRREALAAESLKAAAAEQAQHAAAHKARGDLIGEVERLAAADRGLGFRVEQAASELDVARKAADGERAAEQAAQNEVACADRVRASLRDLRALDQLTTERKRLESAVARVAAAQTAAARARGLVTGSKATRDALAAIRALAAKRDEAAARVEATATLLELLPDGPRQVTHDGRALEPGSPLRLLGRTELRLEGFGRLIVVPGGDEITQRGEALREADRDLAAELAELGVGTVAEAEDATERRRQAEEDLRHHDAEVQGLLQTFDARSLEVLTAQADAADSEIERLEAERERIEAGLDAFGRHVLPAELPAAVREAETALERARECLRQRQEDLESAAARVNAAQTAWTGLEGQRKTAAREAEETRQRLAVARERVADDGLSDAVRDAAERSRQAQEDREALERLLRAAEPDILRERKRMAERALMELGTELQRLNREVRDLEVALREAGAAGWGERLAELEGGEIQAARAEHGRLEREGKAWLLLQGKLQAADQTARNRLLVPVVQRLRPLLQRVFPGAELTLDGERLAPTHLVRDGVPEPFDSLSVGAREQLAVLVRLAFARLLHDREKEASCLILDDALVYADEGRFDAMKAILQQEARDLQILILTCRPRDYFGLDARHLRLEDCGRG